MRYNYILLSFIITIALIALTVIAAAEPYVCGDANGSGEIDIDDVVYIINYIFAAGPEPIPVESGDANASGEVDIDDVVYLISYIFSGGPDPVCYTTPTTTTIIPDGDTTAIQDYDTTTGVIILDESSEYAQDVEIGDVLIGQHDSIAPYGFLKKVTSKTTQGGSVIIETGQATMMEAFETMNISEMHQLLPSDVVSYKLDEGVTFNCAMSDPTFAVALDVVLYDQDGDPGTTDDQIRLDGDYDFTAALFAEIRMRWFSLEKFETGVVTDEQVNLDLIARLQWEFGEELEFDLAEFHLGAIPVGGVVWLVPTLTVEAHIHGDLTVTFETGITYTQELRYGFGWEDDIWYTINESTKDFTYTEPELSVEFNFETGASLNASCLLYGVAGPYVGAKAGFHFLAALNADPCDVELLFDLEAILYAVAGIECDILNLDYNHQWELYTHLIGEWVFPLGGSGTIVLDPNPDILNAPWSLAGPCSYSLEGNGDLTLTSLDPGAYTITWGDVPGWSTPSGEMQNLAADDTVTLIGTYIEDVGTGAIVIDPSPDSINAPWSLVSPDSFSDNGTGDETLTDLTPGEYTITWEDVSGWITPAEEVQILEADEIVTFNGVYVEDSDSTGTVTDIDGNVYQTIKIGDQWWMMENLKVTHYRNGDPIPNVTDDTEWGNLTTGAYCNYDNDEGNVATYGRLYNWYAVGDPRGLAPTGWHIPTDNDWKQLEMYLGMSQAEADDADWRGTDEGGKLKEAGTTHWAPPNTGATNESGFTALPGGYRRWADGFFYYMGTSTSFWSSEEYTPYYAIDRRLGYENSQVSRGLSPVWAGFSVRCVRD